MLLMTLSCGVDKNHSYGIPDTRAEVDINVRMDKLIFKDYSKGNLISEKLKKSGIFTIKFGFKFPFNYSGYHLC